MNRKISTNEKYKYSNEEKLALGEEKNTSVFINITQDADGNIFELLRNLRTNNLRFIILKCYRFCSLSLLFLFHFYCIPKCS